MIHIFLLVFALCLDTFVASAAYGTNQVFLSHRQIVLFNGICSLCLGASLAFGTFLDSRIPESFTRSICFFSLTFLGILRILDFLLRKYLKRHSGLHKKAFFHFSHLCFIINIYSDPMEADADQNQILSLKELVFFSLAMSIDSLVAGAMAAFMKISIPLTVAAAFLMGEAFTYLGLYLGRKLSRRCPRDLSWIGGILFLILAVVKSR